MTEADATHSLAQTLLAACTEVLAAQAAGELSYRSSDGSGYTAMLAVESAVDKAESFWGSDGRSVIRYASPGGGSEF